MKTGTLLVATPAVIGDFNFHRSVILLTSYNKTAGSVGFILNKKIDYTLDELMDGVQSKLPLHFGGPVEQDNLFYIHTLGEKIPKSLPISKDLFWNGDFDTVKKLLEMGELNNQNSRFFLGYSGWTAGQLEGEVDEKSWESFEVKSPLELIKMPIGNLWRECMKTLGGEYLIWSNTPENPSSN
ncbi:MAG: YqgE/AlgH family protein [Flavobacteriaceae bacterium]